MLAMIATVLQTVVGGTASQGQAAKENNQPAKPSDNMMEMLKTLSQQLGFPLDSNMLSGNAFSPMQNPTFGGGKTQNGTFAFAYSSNGTSNGPGGPQCPQQGGQPKKDAPQEGGLKGSRVGGVLNGMMGIAKNVLTGKQPIGASVMVGVLQSIVGASCEDPQQRANIQNCLKQVQDGKPLKECLNQLCDKDKTKLADTIGSVGFEIPECLNEYASDPERIGNSARPDCALKTVEEGEAGRYGGTLAGILTAPLELLRGGGALGI